MSALIRRRGGPAECVSRDLKSAGGVPGAVNCARSGAARSFVTILRVVEIALEEPPHLFGGQQVAWPEGHSKMSVGTMADTNTLGTSTIWLIRRSTATLHSAYAC